MYRLPDITFPFEFPNDDFETSEEGLLAMGGNLHPITLLSAYSKGIFPWFSEGDPLLWFHPNPRMVIFPKKVHVSKKMHSLLRKHSYRVTFNQDFQKVIAECAAKRGKKRTGTWITPELMQSFVKLHEMGFTHSVEVWNAQNKLAGGMYGIALGKIFFGESMFSHEANTSKLALISLCKFLEKKRFLLLDCQVESEHLKTLGAELISRDEFLEYLKRGKTELTEMTKI